MNGKEFKTKYGYFTEDGKEYVIIRPDTPRPWVNVICPNEYGLIISQCGSGYSWYKNASIFRVNRWEQDLIRDNWGKYVYIRDNASKQVWSPTWKPVCRKPDYYECRHGVGYTTIKSVNYLIKSEMTVFVPLEDALEVWLVKIKNESARKRSITLFSYFEWFLGHASETHRELHKLFIHTEYDSKNGIIFARKNDYFGFHTASIKPVSFDTDKETLIGMYRTPEMPVFLEKERCARKQGRGNDAAASLQLELNLGPREEKEVVFIIGVSRSKPGIYRTVRKYDSPHKAKISLEKTKKYWENLINKTTVKTQNKAFDIMTNTWLKYQAISGRINGRTAYYQMGGAIGFRDQLQDSQIFLPLDPSMTRKQILLHASHQYKDGTVQHWWHPVSEEGYKSQFSDDLLWLVFVTINYLKETADFKFLKEKVPFLDEESGSIYEHCTRAIDMSLSRFSKRGLPLIGEADWNDGLSNLGRKWKGESVWVAEFLYGILNDWCELLGRKEVGSIFSSAKMKREIYLDRARKIKDAVNNLAWDGSWYFRATSDSGKVIGSSRCKEGRIFLNAQTWAVINDLVPEGRMNKMLKMVEKYLYRDYGPILFYPAYSKPDPKIGYITNYAPGVRENGGVYTHAATWAILSECKLKRASKAWELYKKICPVYRGQKPDLYLCEPYVTPGNTDGPNSQYYGRGGWTWYTGSAAWLFRIATEWICGVRPTYEGLIVDPCIPPEWKGFKMKRFFRNAYYEINYVRGKTLDGKPEIYVDSILFKEKVIPSFSDGKLHTIRIVSGQR